MERMTSSGVVFRNATLLLPQKTAHTPESVRAKTRSPAERISTIFERLRKKESCSFATSCQEERLG